MNVIGNGEKEKKLRVKERKRKSAGPLNPISPDEGYANDPEELNPTSHNSARACLISVLIYPNDSTQSTMYAAFHLIKHATFRIIIHLLFSFPLPFSLSGY